jgi:hypothetical protein
MNTVIERGLGGPVCGECDSLLPVAGKNNRVCLRCHPEREIEFLDDREHKFLREMMDKKDMSAEAVMRHMFRLGQSVDHFLSLGLTLAFLNPETGETVRPFERLDKKLAPMPGVGNITPAGQCPHCPAKLAHSVMGEYCSAGCGYIDGHYWPSEHRKKDDGLCSHPECVKLREQFLKKPEPPKEQGQNFKYSTSCNRHNDCKAATEKFERDNGRKPGFNFHCHDDECEDCFGS